MHNQRSKKYIRKRIRKSIRKTTRKSSGKINKKRGGMYKHAVEPTLEEIKSNISICFEEYLTKYGWYEPVKKDVKSKAAEITNEFYEIAKKLITENKLDNELEALKIKRDTLTDENIWKTAYQKPNNTYLSREEENVRDIRLSALFSPQGINPLFSQLVEKIVFTVGLNEHFITQTSYGPSYQHSFDRLRQIKAFLDCIITNIEYVKEILFLY